MRGDEVVARKRSPPLALAARDKDDLALFIGETIERCLDGKIGAPFAPASARVREYVGPPFFARGFLRVRRVASSRTKFGEVAVILSTRASYL
jgi:hypothetical protein